LFFICLAFKKANSTGKLEPYVYCLKYMVLLQALAFDTVSPFSEQLAAVTLFPSIITTTPKGNIMKNVSNIAARLALVAAVAGIGAAPLAAQASPQSHHSRSSQCENCGTVVSTHTYERAAERASGLGAGGGAVVGGLLGNQVGSGNGRTLATIAGAVGGAYAGNRVERNMHAVTYTDVRVKMAHGGYRTFTEQGRPRYRNGERVRVQQGHLVR
jgi:outer membrane lipoprotein SlyB